MVEMQKGSPELDYDVKESALYQPVPNMDELRERKKGFRELPIDTSHSKYSEPVVGISEYGIAGQAYYSRPNATTGEPIPDVLPNSYLRHSVVEAIAKINAALKSSAITDFFGSEVELYIEDALRSISLQKRLHDELVPALLRRNQPDISQEELDRRIEDIIAVPSTDPKKPSPHATGGALDIVLRFKQDTLGYIKGSGVPVGHADGDTSLRIAIDFFEQNEPQSEEDRLAQRNRRAYYAIMTGAAFGVNTGLVNNPTEWWHWGRGDQLSEKVRGSQFAYYSLIEPVQPSAWRIYQNNRVYLYQFQESIDRLIPIILTDRDWLACG